MQTNTTVRTLQNKVHFIAGVKDINQFPKIHFPQIAFIGKSNVGKSSLINSICKRKNLARVSHTPGRTQQINFFLMSNKKVFLVDLPGYGFAKISKKERIHWDILVQYYFKTNNFLELVNVLIDIRRGIKNHDINMMNILRSLGHTFQIVLTKSDKTKVNDEVYKTCVINHLSTLGYGHCKILITSSRDSAGIRELQQSLFAQYKSN